MAQFQSAPPYHPSPFVIYGRGDDNNFKEIGDALTAVGNWPKQWQEENIRSNVSNLIIKALTSPRSNARDNVSPELGSLLSGYNPDNDYQQAIGRLSDVGYAGGGFNFNKRQRPIEELVYLESAKQRGRTDLEEQRQRDRIELEKEKTKSRKSLMEDSFDVKDRLQQKRLDAEAKIATMKDKTQRDIAEMTITERASYHKGALANQSERNKQWARLADNNDEIKLVNAKRLLTDKMNDTLASIVKAKQLDQNDPQTVNTLRQLKDNYNQLQSELEGLDPGTPTVPLTEENAPFGWGTIKGLLPGNVPPVNIGRSTTPREKREPRITPKPAPSSQPKTSNEDLKNKLYKKYGIPTQ